MSEEYRLIEVDDLEEETDDLELGLDSKDEDDDEEDEEEEGF
jgi:hypothetical protein